MEAIYRDPARGLNRGAFVSAAKAAGFSAREATDHYEREAAAQQHRRTATAYHSIVAEPGSWAVDLTFYPDYATLPANRKREGILVALEQTSRFAWCRPFRRKTPEEMAPLLAELIREYDVRSVTTDDGNEFKGAVRALFERHKIAHYASSRKGATARVERFNRTLREKISRWFAVSGTHAWVDVLPELVAAHNKTPSKPLQGRTPAAVLSDPDLAAEVRSFDSLRGVRGMQARNALPSGTRVRTALSKARFDKKSGPSWSEDVAVVEPHGDDLLLRVRRSNGLLDRRHYAANELLRVPDGTIERRSAAARVGRVDVPAARRTKRRDQLLARESMDSRAIVVGPRLTRGALPARLRD